MPLCPVLWRSYGEGVGALRRQETAGQEQVSAWGSVAGQFGHLGAERMSSWDPQEGHVRTILMDITIQSPTRRTGWAGPRTTKRGLQEDGDPAGEKPGQQLGGGEQRWEFKSKARGEKISRAGIVDDAESCLRPSDGEEDSEQREEPVRTP